LLYLKLGALVSTGFLLASLFSFSTALVPELANSKEAATWAGVFVTAVALPASWILWFLQAKQAANMQRQALMPHLTFSIHVSRESAPHIQISLVNNGLGPAIIRAYRGSFDGAPIIGRTSEFAHFLTDYFEKLLKGSKWTSRFTSIDGDDWLTKDGKADLVVAETSDPDAFTTLFARPNPRFIAEFNRFRIDVEYQSVFREEIFRTSPWKLEFVDPESEVS
jgi:hypothetical protein